MVRNRSGESLAYKKNRSTWPLIFIGFFLAVTQGCGLVTKFPAQEGVVLDAETKTPIAGAAIVAEYRYEYPTLGGAVSHAASASETVTGPDGRFIIPSKFVTGSFFPIAWFEAYPRFYVFKPGHGSDKFFPNETSHDYGDGYVKDVKEYRDENGYVLLLDKQDKIHVYPPSSFELTPEKYWPNYYKMYLEN